MSFEVITAGELEFPSPSDRERWFASNVDPDHYKDITKFFEIDEDDEPVGSSAITEILSEYIDVTTLDNSLTWYLDLRQHGASVVVRGLVHSEGFQRDFLAVFASAAAFGGSGQVLFAPTEGSGETYAVTCRGGRASFKQVRTGIDPETSEQIFNESMRRANPSAPPASDQGVQTLALLETMTPPVDPRVMANILAAFARVTNPTQREKIAKAIGALGKATRAARAEARKAKAKTAATKQPAAKKLSASKKLAAKKSATKQPRARAKAKRKPR